MSNFTKEKIQSDLDKAKLEGKLRSERIKEIISTAMSQASSEVKEGSNEVGSHIKQVFMTLMDSMKEKRETVKEDVTTSIEGLIEAVSHSRRKAIAQTSEKIQQLQTQLDEEQKQLDQSVDSTLTEIEAAAQNTSSDIRLNVKEAIDSLKDTEEVHLMKKRYAQLRTELAVLQANLSSRYGDRLEETRKYLDDAKSWYETSKNKAEVQGKTPVEEKQTKFEEKISEAGTALARKEKQVKLVLRELWRYIRSDNTKDSNYSN